MNLLLPEITKELERLNAKQEQSGIDQYQSIDGKKIPAPIATFLTYRFPKKTQYFTPADTGRSFPARFVRFGLLSIQESEGRDYLLFAEAGGGNYVLAFSLEDVAEDPYVHKLDAEDFSGSDGAELSAFLADLNLQVKYSDGQ